MKNYRFWTLWLNLLLCATVVVAQTDAPLNHYFTAMTAYNPAAVGMQSEIKATALYRLQWVGLDEGAPKSIFVAADMPYRFRETQNGVGIILFNDDKSTLYKDMYAAAQLAHKRRPASRHGQQHLPRLQSAARARRCGRQCGPCVRGRRHP